MVSLSIDVASSASKANAQPRVGKSDQTSAGGGFGALVDSNVANATTAAPTDAAPPRSQPAPRGESSSSAGDRQDQPSQKNAAATDKTNEPVAAQTDTTVAADASIETPVVTVTLESVANIAAGIVPAEKAAPADDASTDADTSASATTTAAQPVLTGIVAPVAAVPVVAAAIAIDAAPIASTDAITIDAASAAATPAGEKEAVVTTAANASAKAPEQATDQTAIAGVAVAAAPTLKPAVTAQANSETKIAADSTTTSVDIKAQVNSEQPIVEAKPAAKTDTAEQPAAKAEAKTETTPQSDTAALTRDARPAHAASADAQLDTSPAISTSMTPMHQTPQPHAAANANVPPPINASVQLASNIAVPVSGLAVNIAFNANAGRSRFEIRLDPAELGRIDVRLDVDRNGQVTSHLTVERPATLDLLRRDAPQLQRALEDAGLKTGDSGLQFSLRDQSQQQTSSDDRSSRGQSYRLVVDEGSALPAEAGRTYARLAAARGGVDIRI